MTDAQLTAILNSAIESDNGRVVKTNDPELLKKRLYAVRADARKLGDTSFDVLSFRTSPTDPSGELWLVKEKHEQTQPT